MKIQSMITTLIASLSLCSLETFADEKHKQAGEQKNSIILADSHAPIGVMGDHMHQKGEWMVAYRFMTMDMEGNIRDGQDLSPREVATSTSHPYGPPSLVRMVPTEMETSMHMLGLMYAPSDTVTLALGTSYLKKTMTSIMFNMMNNPMPASEMDTSGVGDTKVKALISLYEQSSHHIHANIGLSLPSGSIDETGMMGRAAYGMQLGTGTYDFLPGITYTGSAGQIAWGGQAKATLALNDNKHDYKRDTGYDANMWASYRFIPALSASLRLQHKKQGKIKGRDIGIFAPMVGSNPDNTGRKTTNLGFGINFVSSHGILRGHRFAFEWLKAVDQSVRGVQLEMQDMLTLGYQYAL